MNRKMWRRFCPGRVCVLLGLLFLVEACADPVTAPVDLSDEIAQLTASSNPGVKDFFHGLPPWPDSLVRPSDDAATGATETVFELFEGRNYRCEVTPYSITETPDKIVTLDPDANILWLGALLQGNGYAEGIGSLAELPIRERAPLTISVDILAGNNTRTIREPTLATVHQAVGEMIEDAVNKSNKAGSSVSFTQETTYSVRQAALKLGLSARYYGVGVAANLEASRTQRERTITAYFVQKMFTASVVLPPSPADFFSRELTQERLKREIDRGTIGPNNLPVYVANIVYGRILAFSFTSTESIERIRAALSASYGSLAEAEVSGELLNVLKNAKINVVTVGGEGKNAIALIQNGQLKDYFTEDAALTSAKPISYSVRNLGDNSLALVSETTEYNLKECTVVPLTGGLDIDVTPNSAMVKVQGPKGFIHESTGDQRLRDREPGGYAIEVSKPGFVTKNVDVEVVAGETKLVAVPLDAEQVIGAMYTVTLQGLTLISLSDFSCTDEGTNLDPAEIYYDFRVNGPPTPQVAVTLSRESALSVVDGQFVTFADNSKTVELRVDDGSRLKIEGTVTEADVVSADDPAAIFNITLAYPLTPGPREQQGGVGFNNLPDGCSVTLRYNIQKTGDIVQ